MRLKFPLICLYETNIEVQGVYIRYALLHHSLDRVKAVNV